MLRVVERPLLVQGQLCAEENGDYVIFIDSEQSRDEREMTYWHEIAHLVLLEYGIGNHNEGKIDSIAELLMNQINEDNKMTIEEQVIRLVSEQLGIRESEVSLESNFANDLDADSLDTVELQMACEDEFELDMVPDEIWDDVKTVQQMIDHVLGAKKGT